MEDLSQIANQKRCVIYNELSHITPYYLTPDQARPLDLETEIRFHKRNFYFLALTFDHILICTDNLGAFTRFASADVVWRVICTDWFRRLLESEIIILCGWGSDYGTNLMENQIDYSMRYRPELKPPRLLNSLHEIGANGRMVVREPTYGEKDHITFLRDKLNYLEGRYTFDEISFVNDIIEQTQADYGFIGLWRYSQSSMRNSCPCRTRPMHFTKLIFRAGKITATSFTRLLLRWTPLVSDCRGERHLLSDSAGGTPHLQRDCILRTSSARSLPPGSVKKPRSS